MLINVRSKMKKEISGLFRLPYILFSSFGTPSTKASSLSCRKLPQDCGQAKVHHPGKQIIQIYKSITTASVIYMFIIKRNKTTLLFHYQLYINLNNLLPLLIVFRIKLYQCQSQEPLSYMPL